MPRGDRRRHSGAAGTHHQRVAFVSFLFATRHALRLVFVPWADIWIGIDWPVNRAPSSSFSPCGRILLPQNPLKQALFRLRQFSRYWILILDSEP